MGRPVVHFEFWSENPDDCSKFYQDVFEWNTSQPPGMDYHLVDTGGEGGINGGIMKPQEGPWPGNMAFYIMVDDLEPYQEKVRQAGGKIIVEKQEVPNVGTFSLFEDPDGRVLGMWKQGEQQGGGEA